MNKTKVGVTQMSGDPRNKNEMPDVPKMDFVGSMVEIWSALNCAAYHLAFVRVYLQTAALQTPLSEMVKLEQDLRNKGQADLVICRAHLAAFFWQLDHIFEALDISVKRGQKENPEVKYFWSYENQLKKIEQESARKEINAYRNKAHEAPASSARSGAEITSFFIISYRQSVVSRETTTLT